MAVAVAACRQCGRGAVAARGLCWADYQRARRAGALPPLEFKPRPSPEPEPYQPTALERLLEALSWEASERPWSQINREVAALPFGSDLQRVVEWGACGNLKGARALCLATLDRFIRS